VEKKLVQKENNMGVVEMDWTVEKERPERTVYLSPQLEKSFNIKLMYPWAESKNATQHGRESCRNPLGRSLRKRNATVKKNLPGWEP